MNNEKPSINQDYPQYNYKLTPFKLFTLQNFPYIEADFDAVTNYQLFCKVVDYLNEVIANENTVESIVQQQIDNINTLYNWFNELDVQDEINNKLDEMVSDGTLDSIVSRYISIQDNNYIKDICTLAYRPSSVTRGLQGGCYCGGNIIACYFTSTHTIQVISLTTGQVLREYSNELFGHGNGMCYKDNYLYLCGTGGGETNKVYKIPFDTLDSVEVIDPYGENLIPAGTNISSICYSPNTNHFYITQGLPFPTLYCYELNDDFTELINTYTYDNGNAPYGGFITNICHWNKYILINYNFGKTDLFNENDFSLYKTINIDKNVGNRYYSEVEWLDTYENNELIIGAICHSGEGYGDGIFSFGTCNLYCSYRDYPGNYRRGKSTTGEGKTRQNNVFVNTNATFNVKRLGTQESPFISIYEATNSCQLDGFEETIINLLEGSDISNTGIYLSNTQLVKIISTQNNLLCRDMRFQSNRQVYIRGITPINTLYLKETNVTLNCIPDNEVEIDVEGYNTSILNIHTTQNKIKLKGHSEGMINFNNFNQENGLVGVLNSTADGYTDFIQCRNINNVMQRGRLSGGAYTPTKTMTFFINYASVKEIHVQIGLYYINLPFCNTYHNINYNYLLQDGSLLNVKITTDTTTYENRTVWKYELEHPTLLINDAIIVY